MGCQTTGGIKYFLIILPSDTVYENAPFSPTTEFTGHHLAIKSHHPAGLP